MPERRRHTWKIVIGIAVVYALISAAIVSIGEVGRVRSHLRGWKAWHMDAMLPDGYDYVNIAVSLAKGRGFGRDFSDEDFRRMVWNAHRRGWYRSDEFDARTRYTPTASRAPIYPALCALLFRLGGYSYALPRQMNCVLIALTGVLVFLSARRLGGTRAGLLAAGVLLLNTRLLAFGKQVLTEPLAVAMIALSLYLLIRCLQSPKPARWLVAGGLALGLTVLSRSALVFCVPFFVGCLVCVGDAPLRRRAIRAALYLLLCSLPILGWTVRNSRVAGFPVALGTRGGFDLPACYTRVCLENGGRWRPWMEQPYAAEMRAAWDRGGEWAAYQTGRKLFFRVFGENWRLLPALVLAKLKLMLVPLPIENFHDWADLVLIVLAAVGAVLLRHQRALCMALPPILGSLAMATAYHAMARFRLPMLPGLAVLAGCGLAALLGRLRRRTPAP